MVRIRLAAAGPLASVLAVVSLRISLLVVHQVGASLWNESRVQGAGQTGCSEGPCAEGETLTADETDLVISRRNLDAVTEGRSRWLGGVDRTTSHGSAMDMEHADGVQECH